MIKRTLHGAAKNAKLLACTSLCHLHVEYAFAVWDKVLEYQIKDIELIQHSAAHSSVAFQQPSRT